MGDGGLTSWCPHPHTGPLNIPPVSVGTPPPTPPAPSNGHQRFLLHLKCLRGGFYGGRRGFQDLPRPRPDCDDAAFVFFCFWAARPLPAYKSNGMAHNVTDAGEPASTPHAGKTTHPAHQNRARPRLDVGKISLSKKKKKRKRSQKVFIGVSPL